MQALTLTFVRLPRRTRLYLEIGWLLVIAKCLATPWIVDHYQIPFGPGWVIIPTLAFAALVTLVVLVHRED